MGIILLFAVLHLELGLHLQIERLLRLGHRVLPHDRVLPEGVVLLLLLLVNLLLVLDGGLQLAILELLVEGVSYEAVVRHRLNLGVKSLLSHVLVEILLG